MAPTHGIFCAREANYEDFLGLDLRLVGEQQLAARTAEPRVEEVHGRHRKSKAQALIGSIFTVERENPMNT